MQQKLIIAHEIEHARRRDGWWNLLMQLNTAIFWFHPLAWWVRIAFIRDQELACDAAGLRANNGLQRSYANAMLKSQEAAMSLPVGCAWSPRHPLAERIDMLKQPFPGNTRHRVSMILASGLIIATTAAAYAAGQKAHHQSAASTASLTSNEYQLDIMFESSIDIGKSSHAERATLALCMQSGESGEATTHAWRMKAIPSAMPGNRVSIAMEVTNVGSSHSSKLHVIDEVGATVPNKVPRAGRKA